MDSKFNIVKFDGKKNFSLWQSRMKDVLIQSGLEDTLEKKGDGVEEAKWSKLNAKAMSAIRLCLEDEVVYNVMEESSASSMWTKLEELYMGKNFTNRLVLKQSLYAFQKKEGVDIHSHIGSFNKLVCDLANCGVKIEEEDLEMILLTSVKSSHKQLFSTMLYGRDSLTVEQVKKALISSEQIETEDIESEAQAIIAHQKSGNFAWQGGGRRGPAGRLPIAEVTCYRCWNKGHLSYNCPEGKKTEDVVATCSDGFVYGDVLAITNEKMDDENGWIMDSACSHHVCPKREWFSSYKQMKGKVTMGNNSECDIHGIGTVQLLTSNGLMRTLDNVLHVPDVKRNVISLGAVVGKGCSFEAHKSLLWVRRNSRVMLLGKKVGNLYVLLGHTFLGNNSVRGGATMTMKK